MPRYGMVIDLDRCVGCHACTAACRAEHATPPGVRWTRVAQVDEGVYPRVRRSFVPRGCMHCAKPPCVEVCPTGASYKRPDGVVLVDRSRCIGCKTCVLACPYDARSFVDGLATYFPEGPTPYERARPGGEHERGTVEKCTFCVERIAAGLQPACVETCPTKARYFGDLEDAESEVSRLAGGPRAVLPSPEWRTEPSVSYLLPYVRGADGPGGSTAPEGEIPDQAAAASGPSAAAESEAAPGRGQTEWGWNVALYLALSSAGAGAYLAWQVAQAFDATWGVAARPGVALAIALVALGALFVLSDLGRWSRFYLAVLRVGSSWESRAFVILSAFGVLGLAQIATWLVPLGGWDTPLSWALALLALTLLPYGGLLLSSLRAFPLWTHPFQVALFVVSALLAGSGVLALDPLGALSAEQMRSFGLSGAALGALEAVLLAALLWRLQASGGAGLASARALVVGTVARQFWVGAVGLGLVVPIAAGVGLWTEGVGSDGARLAGAAALVGVVFLRYAVLAAAHRHSGLSFRGRGPWGISA